MQFGLIGGNSRQIPVFVLSVFALVSGASAATCQYNTTLTGYSCNPFFANTTAESQPLVITGTHETTKNDPDIVSVQAQDSLISDFPNAVLQKFSNLKYLRLNNVAMTSISQLQSCERLEKLTLYRNEISSIAANTFTNCLNLVELDLGRNKLSSISSDWFAGIGNLERLFLDTNAITAIGKQDFSLLSKLETLQLSDNEISTVDEGKLISQSLPRLKICSPHRSVRFARKSESSLSVVQPADHHKRKDVCLLARPHYAFGIGQPPNNNRTFNFRKLVQLGEPLSDRKPTENAR